MKMKFKIDQAIFEKFPELNIGVLEIKRMDNKGKSEEVLSLLTRQQADIKSRFSKETYSENPKIKSWRDAYSLFGAKPKKYTCSVDNLYRMTLSGIELRHINKLVDIYNYISIKHIVPVGGDDIDFVDGDITLTIAKGNEIFKELNAEEIKNPEIGEVIYQDDKEVLCRRWNWRECDKSKMTEDTKNALLVIEGLPPVSEEEIKVILDDFSGLIKKYCGGEAKMHLLNKNNQEIEVKK